MKSLAKICLVLLTAAIGASTVNAQTDATTSTNAVPAVKKSKSKMFSGKIASVDAAAKTISVDGAARNTFTVNSKTKIFKDGQPATLEDASVGEHVRVTARQDDSGNWVARSLHIGQPSKAPAASAPPAMPGPAPADK